MSWHVEVKMVFLVDDDCTDLDAGRRVRQSLVGEGFTRTTQFELPESTDLLSLATTVTPDLGLEDRSEPW